MVEKQCLRELKLINIPCLKLKRTVQQQDERQ